MDLHPVFVHFPIALLTLYSICELIRVRKLLESDAWFHIKAFLAIAGSIFSFITYLTGNLLEDSFEGMSLERVLRMHQTFAGFTVAIFAIIALAYLVRFLQRIINYYERIEAAHPVLKTVWGIAAAYGSFVSNPSLIVPLALLGLVSVTITGALGGSLVYGPDADPLVSFLYYVLSLR